MNTSIEEDFTNVLMVMVQEFIRTYPTAVTVVMERKEENRFLYIGPDTVMSITVNRISDDDHH